MRVLIVRLGSIGDIVHAMPMVAALRADAGRAREVGWLVEEALAPVVRLCAGVDEIVTMRTRAVTGEAGWTGAVRRLRARRYDVALDAQGLVKSAVLARLSGAPRVIGFTRRHLREPLAAACYTDAVDPTGAVHVIDKNVALLSALGIGGVSPRIRLAPVGESATARDAAARFGGRFVLVNPGANWPNK